MGRKKKTENVEQAKQENINPIEDEWILLNDIIKKDKKETKPTEVKAEVKPINIPEVSVKPSNEESLSLFRRVGRTLLNKKNISSTEFKRIAESQLITEYRYAGYFKFLSWNRLAEWYKNKYHRGRIFFIIMQLKNGKYEMFTTRSIFPYFEHRGGMYIIDPDMAREDLHSKHSALFYHQDFAAPFKIEFDVTKIHDTIVNSDEDKTVDKALNPSTLKFLINSQVIEKLIKAHEISDKLQLMMILIIINLIITAVIGIIVGKSSGMF